MNLSESGRNGPFQPPRNSVTAIEQIVMMFEYSPRKNSPKRMLEYSVWKPATSSDSASGRSNGVRFVSASAVIMNSRNATGWTATNQRCSCALTMSTIDSEPVSSRTPIVEMPIASSYEIICADDRSPPISAYLLFDAHPPSTTAYTPMLHLARNTSRPTL